MEAHDLDDNGLVSMWEFANQFLPEVARRYIARGAELKSAKRDLACLEVIAEHHEKPPIPSKWWTGLPTIRAANETNDNRAEETNIRRARAAVACLTALTNAERDYLCYRIGETLQEGVGRLVYTDRNGNFFDVPATDFDVIDIDLEAMKVELGTTTHGAPSHLKSQEVDIPNLLIRMSAGAVQA